MGSSQFLILSTDGARPSIIRVDRAGLLEYLDEVGKRSADGSPNPVWLERWPAGDSIDPGQWPEGTEMILRVEIVVPEPVTVKWAV